MNQKLAEIVKKRAELWDQIAFPLNDIYVYFLFVGHWKEISATRDLHRLQDSHATKAILLHCGITNFWIPGPGDLGACCSRIKDFAMRAVVNVAEVLVIAVTVIGFCYATYEVLTSTFL